MNALVRALARLARTAPVIVIIVTVLATAALGGFAGQQEMDQSQESFSPDSEELEAIEFAGEAFEGSTATLVQVLFQGDDVTSADGLRAVQSVRGAIQSQVDPSILADQGGQGPFTSFLGPVEGAVASGQLDPASADDAAIDAAYAQGLEQLPAEFQGLTRQLIAGDDPASARSALGLVFLDTDAIIAANPDVDQTTAIVSAVQDVSDVIESVETPLQVNAFAFELFFEPDDSFQAEVGRLFGIAALVIVVILFIVYLVSPTERTSRAVALRRAAADTGLTLFTILASITWMQGFGVLLGPDYLGVIGAFSPPTQIIPILLIGLGVDYAIHLISRYREEISQGFTVDQGISRATQTVGIALVLATITTALGFLTNLTNPVPAIRDFGILAAVGIGSAFLMMLTFVPAVRTLLDRRGARRETLPREALATGSESRLSRLMASTSVLAEVAPVPTLAIALVLGGLGGYGLTNLSTEFSFADFVPSDSPLRETFLTIEDEFGGGFGERTQIVLRGDVATTEAHNATAESLGELADVDGVLTFGDRAAAESPVSILQQTVGIGLAAQGGGAPPAGADGAAPPGQPAGEGQPGQTPPGAEGQQPGAGGPGAPDPAALGIDPAAAGQLAQLAVSQGFDPQTGTFGGDADVAAIYDQLLVANAGAAAVLATDDSGAYVASLVAAQTQSSAVGAIELRDGIDEAFAGLESQGVDVVATSNQIVSDVIVNALSSSQVSSLAVTLIAALLLLVITFGIRDKRPALGAITIIPVVFVVLWVFGTMAATGIPFGPVTAMISALAIGIGVPFTIHITHRFTEDLDEHGGDIDAALRSTMRHTGGALAGSAFTTMAGFAILVTSSLIPFRQLGLVTAYAIGFSLLAAVLVLPSMLALWARYHVGKGHDATVVTHELVDTTTSG